MEGHPAHVAGLEPISEAQMQVKICKQPVAGFDKLKIMMNTLDGALSST